MEEHTSTISLHKVIMSLSERIISYKTHEMENIQSVNVNFALFEYIYAIGELENPTFGDLAEKLNISKPAVTAIVNKLIQHGIACKQQSHEDKRVFYVTLTDTGRYIAAACQRAHTKLEDFIRGKLSDEEYNQLLNLFAKII